MKEINKNGNACVCGVVSYVTEMVDGDSSIQCQGEELK